MPNGGPADDGEWRAHGHGHTTELDNELPSFSEGEEAALPEATAGREQPERGGGVHQDSGPREGPEEYDCGVSEDCSSFDIRGDLESQATSGEILGSQESWINVSQNRSLSAEQESAEQQEKGRLDRSGGPDSPNSENVPDLQDRLHARGH